MQGKIGSVQVGVFLLGSCCLAHPYFESYILLSLQVSLFTLLTAYLLPLLYISHFKKPIPLAFFFSDWSLQFSRTFLCLSSDFLQSQVSFFLLATAAGLGPMAATTSRARAELQLPKKWKERETSPERTKVWTEPNRRKVSVVYYLSRNGQLEHPHFMEVPLSSSDGLFLRGNAKS